jgi:hypothetical protein
MFRPIAVFTAMRTRNALKRSMFRKPEGRDRLGLVGVADSATILARIGRTGVTILPIISTLKARRWSSGTTVV